MYVQSEGTKEAIFDRFHFLFAIDLLDRCYPLLFYLREFFFTNTIV